MEEQPLQEMAPEMTESDAEQEEEDDAELGEMKAKFDKIMSNFADADEKQN